jgi:carbamoyltransferase
MGERITRIRGFVLPAFEDLLGPRRSPTDPLNDRHRDVARSAQAMYEAASQNARSPVGVIHCVQPAAGDAGGAIGAAFAVWHNLGGKGRNRALT